MSIPDEAVEAAVQVIRADTDKALTAPLPELIRTILEAAAPYMITQVYTVEELDGLPRFSVIRDDDSLVFERHTMWHEAGSRDLKYSPDIALPATVLQFGWGEE